MNYEERHRKHLRHNRIVTTVWLIALIVESLKFYCVFAPGVYTVDCYLPTNEVLDVPRWRDFIRVAFSVAHSMYLRDKFIYPHISPAFAGKQYITFRKVNKD